MLKIKRRLEGSGVGMKFVICLAISFVIILITALISALILNGLEDPSSNLGLFSLIAMLISAAVSGIISMRVEGGSLRFASLVALAVVLIMLLINVILCGGKVSGGAFMNYGCYFGVASLSALIGRKRERRPKHRY